MRTSDASGKDARTAIRRDLSTFALTGLRTKVRSVRSPGHLPSPRWLATAAILLPSFAAFVGCIAAACSSSNGPSATTDAGADAETIDAPLGPVFCNLPVPATCPTTAPCTAAGWACAETACDGYFVVTDGTWVYYYSLPGGELAGEVLAADAAFVSCPYGFIPPTCAPVVASECANEAGGTSDSGGTQPEGGATSDSGSVTDGGLLDAGGAIDGGDASDGGGAIDAD